MHQHLRHQLSPTCLPMAGGWLAKPAAQPDKIIMITPGALPRPLEPIRISPFNNGLADAGRFLVEAGSRGFVMSPAACTLVAVLAEFTEPSEVRRALYERTGDNLTDDELQAAIQRLPRALFEQQKDTRADELFLLRFQLLEESRVHWLARRLQPLFNGWVAGSLLGFGLLALPFCIAGLLAPPPLAELTTAGSGCLLLALLLSAGVHELGHAAACQRFGVAPGHIGFGVYWVFPVFYADVTKAWRLTPPQRMVVDLGGLYFQAAFLLSAVPLLLLWPGNLAVRLFFFYNIAAMVHNLNPIFKMDGYWLLADFAQVPNLHRRTLAQLLRMLGFKTSGVPAMDRRMQRVLGGYAALIVLYLVSLVFWIPRWVESGLLLGWELGAQKWILAAQHFNAGAWVPAGTAGVQGSLAILAAGLPLLAVPWALAKGAASLCRMINGPAQAESCS